MHSIRTLFIVGNTDSHHELSGPGLPLGADDPILSSFG